MPNAEKTDGKVRGFALFSSGQGRVGQGEQKCLVGLIPTAKTRGEEG
jgi:hypothetical protein